MFLYSTRKVINVFNNFWLLYFGFFLFFTYAYKLKMVLTIFTEVLQTIYLIELISSIYTTQLLFFTHVKKIPHAMIYVKTRKVLKRETFKLRKSFAFCSKNAR